MNLFKKIERGFTALAMALVRIEQREREGRLEERLKRLQQKDNFN